MKKLVYILVFPLMLAASPVLNAQNYAEGSLGLPGDNLNLFAVMKVFQESETLEEFERNLNDENSRINNLDLNGDNYIDYIRVTDKPEGNVHVIVLQVAINARENQDVAVFIVERESNNQVRIQLIGDEALYGKDYIVEPNYADTGETPNPGYIGTTTVVDGQNIVVRRVTTYEVAAWPLVHFIFLPSYVIWHSPWYWGYYPHWWSPWRPYYWHYYYGYHSHWYPEYYGYYRHSNHHYHPQWHNNYYGQRRAYSPYVSNHVHSGYYRATYSHPETRRAGSELYTRTYPNGANRITTRSTGNSQVTHTSTRTTGGTVSTRRDGTSGTQGTAVNRQTNRTTGNTQVNRQTTRTTSGSVSTRRDGTSGTSGTAVSRPTTRKTETNATKPATRSSGVSNSSSRSRQTEATSGRTTSNSGSTKSTVKTETRRSSEGSRVSNGSSSRRSSGSNQGSRSTKSTEKSSERSSRSSSGRR